MGGLLHDFHLVNRGEFDYWNSSHFHNHPQAVLVHDDVIRYMSDCLKWISCHVPMTPPILKEMKGLNFYGPTIIKSDGADQAFAVFEIWAQLFSQGPKTLELTGAWSSVEGESEQSGHYEIIVAERDNLVASLKQIAEYAKQVERSDGLLYILHLGI